MEFPIYTDILTYVDKTIDTVKNAGTAIGELQAGLKGTTNDKETLKLQLELEEKQKTRRKYIYVGIAVAAIVLIYLLFIKKK